ncbi:PTS system cellobiose-specific IIC component [Lachnospiraceae bacterium PF1-21]|uniref:Permease IIC component n=1 Tax=Ohessyouella blattaphilus TaxID=2949333 RepID=A0ABT1EJH2_9FIRM|nr:PTS sugar transporter subunit IIC [Ohessyouella blattaphilus]MCP1110859.1 PTS sugar transporter subunit IIC [Ohessyouella blattaphilus]MCR8564253.1 PTS sugar transporter subunit IIC [Ohessyouella blattaphilus]
MGNNSFIDKFSAVAGRIGQQRHLGAVRDGFVSLMPLMIVGSLVTLINNLPIGRNTLLKEKLAEIPGLAWITTINGNVWWGTFGMISLFSVMAIAYYLAKSYEGNALSAALVSLAAYLSAVPQMAFITTEAGEEVAGWGFINYRYTNAQGLIVGVIIALIGTEIFVRLSRSDKLIIKMPDGVPPAVSRSFAALIPGVITIIAISFITVMIELVAKNNVFDLIYENLAKPLAKGSDTWGFGLIIVLLTHVFWVFGIHGANMFEGVLQTLNLMAVDNNTALLESGATEGFTYFSKSFLDAFVYMGGAGVCIGLVIALLVAGKSKQNRMVGRLGLLPSVFNINEPIIFGLPIVLNPIFAIPFVLAPILCFIVAYGASRMGILPAVSVVIPWTTPPILSGLFATNFKIIGPIIQVINLAISVLVYIPFVKIADRIEMKKEAQQAEAAE